jgi:hypothetical protein
MAVTNHERVGKALDLLKDGLAPFVERELKADFGWGCAVVVRVGARCAAPFRWQSCRSSSQNRSSGYPRCRVPRQR